jgi:hypothetical protein
MSERQLRRTRNRQAFEKRPGIRSIGHSTGPLRTPDLRPSHGTSRNPIWEGIHGGAPDPEAFRAYMCSRARKGHIPTLLKDWVTAHAKYQSQARDQVRAWIQENRHLFRGSP